MRPAPRYKLFGCLVIDVGEQLRLAEIRDQPREVGLSGFRLCIILPLLVIEPSGNVNARARTWIASSPSSASWRSLARWIRIIRLLCEPCTSLSHETDDHCAGSRTCNMAIACPCILTWSRLSLPSACFELDDILFGVSPARALLPPPHVDVADLAVLDQRAWLVLGDLEPVGGFARRQQRPCPDIHASPSRNLGDHDGRQRHRGQTQPIIRLERAIVR